MESEPDRADLERLTARQLITNRQLSVVVECNGCRSGRPLNPWRIGERLGDTPLKELKFVCSKCRRRATSLQVWAQNVGTSRPVASITLERPRPGYGTGMWIDP